MFDDVYVLILPKMPMPRIGRTQGRKESRGRNRDTSRDRRILLRVAMAEQTPQPTLSQHESSQTRPSRTESFSRTQSRIGRPSHHRQKHRGQTADGALTYKKQTVSQLQLEIQRGIRAVVEQSHFLNSQRKESQKLTPADCEQVFRVRIPADDEVLGDFTAKSHGARAFAHVRQVLGVGDDAFVDSICDHPLEMLPTPGKSGALFFKSSDGRYLLKTVSKGESKFFRSILADYATHIEDMTLTHGLRTLLPHFYELIHIDTPAGRNIRLVIMNNLAPVGIPIHERYDLKGSWVGRWTKDADTAAATGATLKDVDATHVLRCSAVDRNLIAEQIGRDSAWLEAHGVIDYSLLCLHHFPGRAPVPHAIRAAGSAPAPAPSAPSARPAVRGHTRAFPLKANLVDAASDDNGEEVHAAAEPVEVYCGIIDVLQSWRLFKRAEHVLKAIRYPTQSSGVSVTDPRSYAKRFRERLIARFESDQVSADDVVVVDLYTLAA